MSAPHHSVFLQAGCPFCHLTNSVKALKAICVYANGMKYRTLLNTHRGLLATLISSATTQTAADVVTLKNVSYQSRRTMLDVLVLNAVDDDVRVGAEDDDEVDKCVEQQDLVGNPRH